MKAFDATKSLLFGSLAVVMTIAIAGCQQKEKILDIDTPGVDVDVDRDVDTGAVDVDVNEN